jgi:hypothetical protein
MDRKYPTVTEVRSDRPLPQDMPRHDRPGRADKYPWLLMNPGDSFLWPKEMNIHVAWATTSMANRRFEKAYRLGKGPKRRFHTKRTEEGLCCWRVE